jgi:hypothetical protein
MTKAEVHDSLTRAERRFANVCMSATDAQWRFRPVTGWSMPEVVDHVTMANRNLLPVLSDVLVASPLWSRFRDFDDEDMPYLFYGGGGEAPPGS